MSPISEKDFPLLGSTGAESQYCIPSVKSLDDVVEVIGVAEMKDTISIRRLKRDNISVDDLPLRAYILGRVNRYGGSPCKSGELHGQDILLVGKPALNRDYKAEYLRSVPLYAFNDVYGFICRFNPFRKDKFISFLGNTTVVLPAFHMEERAPKL